MRNFLDDSWKLGTDKGYLFLPTLMDQQAITEVIRDSTLYSAVTQILPAGILQSYLGHENEGHPEKVLWKKNDFAGHMIGLHNSIRMKILIPLLQQDDPFNLLHS